MDETGIRSAIDDRANAIEQRAASVAQSAGRADARCFAVLTCEICELSVTIDGDEADCDGLLHIKAARGPTASDPIDVFTPAAFSLQRIDGIWAVTRERLPSLGREQLAAS